jgi:hypothetical protein
MNSLENLFNSVVVVIVADEVDARALATPHDAWENIARARRVTTCVLRGIFVAREWTWAWESVTP